MDKFITYKSKISGTISFIDVACTKIGQVVFKFKVRKLYVKRHKSFTAQTIQTEEELIKLDTQQEGMKELSSDDDLDIDELEKASELKTLEEDEEDDEDDSEQSDSDISEPGETIEVIESGSESDESEEKHQQVKLRVPRIKKKIKKRKD